MRNVPKQNDFGGILPATVAGVSFKANGATLLDDVNAVLDKNATTVIMGPNGAGKSLFLRLLHGLLHPTEGEIRWNGRVPVRAVRLRQSMVFQRPILLRRSVAGNVHYVLRVHGVHSRAKRVKRVEEVLEQAGLSALAHRQARVLSGGEQQRLALARAWATHPEVLLLDEPTANLDPYAIHAFESMIAEIKSRGAKIVLTTHDLGQARRLADEVLFLHRGRLLEQTPAARFFQVPESEEARTFVSGGLVL
jgi:tungstate transport system ATP-binding protein